MKLTTTAQKINNNLEEVKNEKLKEQKEKELKKKYSSFLKNEMKTLP